MNYCGVVNFYNAGGFEQVDIAPASGTEDPGSNPANPVLKKINKGNAPKTYSKLFLK
jgi:hypothetical protein